MAALKLTSTARKTSLKSIACASVAALGLALAGPAAAQAPKLSALDIFELEIAADPQISPDGRQIVYVRRSNDIMTDRAIGNLWIVNADGSNHRPLLSGRDSYSSPRWSPDGTRLAYVSSAEGSPQIYVRWMDTGATALVTNVQSAPQGVAWSPDGDWIAFSMSVDASGPDLGVKPPKKPEGANWSPPPKVIDRVFYRADGRGFLDPAYNHIFVAPAHGGSARQVTAGDFNHNAPLSWSADGSTIVFSANREEGWELDSPESDLYAVSVADGAITRLTTRDGPDRTPVYSPNGRLIAYTGFDDLRVGYRNANLYVMNADGSNIRNLTEDFDYSVGNIQWAGDDAIYFQYVDRGETKVASASLRGRISTAAQGLSGLTIARPYSTGDFSVAPNGTLAVTQGETARPSDIAVIRRGGGARRVTALNDDLLPYRNLGEVRELTWPSSYDGREIQGWIIMPPDAGPGPHPLILEIHGGPHSAYGPVFSAELQRMAAAGYAVLYTNPRGSTSYGEEFALEIQYNYPGQDYDDLISGVDHAIALGLADPDQLYVTGGSGGGVLTAWIVGMTDRFKAAVVAKPVINWISFNLTADGYVTYNKNWFATPPWEDPQEYWRRSPLSLVGNVTTPSMLLTGEADMRTPIAESEQFYQALKLRGVDTALVRIPGSPHGIANSAPSRLNAKVDHILAWFDKYKEQ